MFWITYPDDDGTDGDSETIDAHYHCESPQPARSAGLINFWIFVHAIIALVS